MDNFESASKIQLLHQYYINYDLWDMQGPSTRVVETSLKYYIGAGAGHS